MNEFAERHHLQARHLMSLVLTIGLVLGSLLYSINAFASGTTVEITSSMSASEVETFVQEALDSSTAGETIEVLGDKTDEVAQITLTIPAGTTLLWKAETEGLTFETLGEGSFIYSPALKSGASDALPADEDSVDASEDDTASAPDTGDQPDEAVVSDSSPAVQEDPAQSAVGSGLALLELKAVRLAGAGTSFDTISEAVAAAGAAGLSTYTLEVGGDVTESGTVAITANVTIIGVDGPHTIASGLTLKVDNGGSLTLGNGSTASLLTFKSASVKVLNGSITTYDGVRIESTSAGNDGILHLEGPNARGAIYGGTFTGAYTGLDLSRGAYISVIAGGSFDGVQDAVHVSDAGTRVELISGGSFYQTTPNQSLHGHAFFLQDNATIGNISGGYFEAVDNCAMVVIRGAWIDEISGGVFKANRLGTTQQTWNATLRIESENTKTGVGSISGGSFSGGYFGALVINRNTSAPGARIDSISGGTFTGTVGLQNDVKGWIGEISGGTIKSNKSATGLMNAGSIGNISGTVVVTGSPALWNYAGTGSSIQEISGGSFDGGTSSGFSNSGTVNRISGGTFIGWDGVSNNGMNKGRLNEITGGVFYGRYGYAITVAYELKLEPGLAEDIGFGRFISANGKDIFDNENYVKYPPKYRMSTTSELMLSAPGITATKFRYLRQDDYLVTVNDSYAANSGTGRYVAGKTVTIDAGNREGYTFSGWTLDAGKVALDNVSSATTTFTMPAEDVTVTANWQRVEYQVTVVDSYATKTGAGSYFFNDPVAIDAGSREGYVFSGWLTTDGAAFANAQSSATGFSMPSHDVVVTATWTAIDYKVTVVGSYADQSGEGTYHLGDQVTIDAGLRPGYFFAGWQTTDGVSFDDNQEALTGFKMPSHDVTVTANWQPIDYTVTVVGSYATESGEGTYHLGDQVTIDAGSRRGYAFAGWQVDLGAVTLADPSLSATGFEMPAADVTVTATWQPINYKVTVVDSYADPSGEGTYHLSDKVALDAGTREGYTFIGWTIGDDPDVYSSDGGATIMAGGDGLGIASTDEVALSDADAQTATFTMPAADVRVTAHWQRIEAVASSFTVTFVDWNGVVLKVEQVALNGSATAPSNPARLYYNFTGWDRSFTGIVADITVTALYSPIPSPSVTPPSRPGGTTTPSRITPSTPAVVTQQELVTAAVETGAPVVAVGSVEIPLVAIDAYHSWALANLILCLIGLLLAIPAGIRALLYKGRKASGSDSQGEQADERRRNKRGLVWLVLGTLLAMAGVILFILTENMSYPMVFVDRFTVLNLIILLVEALVLWLLFKSTKNTDENTDQGSYPVGFESGAA